MHATGAAERSDALADALVFTPNRRAARELALALFRAAGRTLLSPDIRALGDLDTSDEDALLAGEDADLPPAIAPERRRGALARLIQGWRAAQGEPDLPPASALAAADELSALIDQASIAGDVRWSDVLNLSLSADLASHWRLSAGFLEIVARHWPAYLADNGVIDGMYRRRLAADRLADRWAAAAPAHPVVIAGSTGATAAGQILMRAVLQLPMGAIVLPGLDPEIDTAGWKLIARSPSHPQHALFATLTALGLKPEQVRPWPGLAETSSQRARRRLVNESLAPAEATRGWNERLAALARPVAAADLVREGLAGVRLVEAEDESAEAHVAALLLRETLEQTDLTAALVTPEAGLARRVAAILARWSIDLAPSSGTRLHLTPAASFLLLVARWAADPADPVALLSVLKHPRARVGLDPADLRQRVSDMEIRALSGPRLDADLASLAQRLSQGGAGQGGAGQGAEALARELADLHHRLSPPLLQRRLTGPDGCEGLSRMAMALAAGPGDPEGANLYAGRSGDLAARFLEQLAGLIEAMGGLDSARFADLAEATAMGVQAPPDKPEHPRIAIWGPLEARLQRRDRMILASLNEGAWPRLPPAESFLNRRLRREAGLPDPDERVGLSAHDFAQLASAPDLILLRARRVDDKPAVASRWLWRLRTLAAGGLGDSAAAEAVLRPIPGQDPLAWADALRTPPRTEGLKPPAPKPPVHLRRLGKLSPSRVGRLIRDPYADFATVVLRLEPRLRPGAPFDAASRGRALHTALERFMAAPGATAEELDHLIRTGLIAAGGSPEAIELERPLWQAAARAYLNWTLGRQERVVRTVTEAKAAITLPVDGDPVVLEARADRIDLLVDGTLAIIDYKSGQPKRAPQVQSGLEPQLALEAAIAARAPFGAIGPAPASELIYYRIAASAALDEERNGQSLAFKDATTPEVAEAALDGLVRLVRGFRDPAHPYLSRPRVEFVWSASDYDRLARREEWAIEEGDGS